MNYLGIDYDVKNMPVLDEGFIPVSYTHLDVYKRQPLYPLFHRQIATGYQESMISGFKPIATTGLVFLGASPKA